MNKWFVYIGVTALGLLGGYLYWHFHGCTEGCSITGVWYNSTAYGGLLGYLAGGMIVDHFIKK